MNTSKDYVHKLIEELTDKELPEILDFIEYIKSSLAFWDNQIDDEVWNHI
jgi:hypothetical protein